jgi:hypothetical protein
MKRARHITPMDRAQILPDEILRMLPRTRELVFAFRCICERFRRIKIADPDYYVVFGGAKKRNCTLRLQSPDGILIENYDKSFMNYARWLTARESSITEKVYFDRYVPWLIPKKIPLPPFSYIGVNNDGTPIIFIDTIDDKTQLCSTPTLNDPEPATHIVSNPFRMMVMMAKRLEWTDL